MADTNEFLLVENIVLSARWLIWQMSAMGVEKGSVYKPDLHLSTFILFPKN